MSEKQNCLKCGAPFWTTGKQSYMVYECYCGNLQTLSGEQIVQGREITATEITERNEKLCDELQYEITRFLEPLVQRIIYIMEKRNGHRK